MERVVITGIGMVSPLAIGLEESWKLLLAGQSGAAPITSYDTTPFRVKFACQVKGWDPERFIEPKKVKEMDRFCQFAMGAARMAWLDAGLELSDEERELTGAIIGVGMGGLATLERAKEIQLSRGPGKISPYSIPALIANMASGQVSMAWGLKGPTYCVTSACASSAHAIGESAQWIRRGLAPVMLAGGAEATVTPIGMGGFEAMFALSRRNDEPTRASRPFDKGRDGFVCGEGSAVLVLESLSRATQRGAKIYAEVTGYGATSDAHHLTHPAPSGEGAQRAMRQCLREAKLRPEDVDYINAHGTSTPQGDIAESQAVLEVFGAHAAEKKLWISSTKSMTGHLLGGAGALESAFCALALRDGVAPPTINLDEPDPQCPLEYVAHTARPRAMRHAINNSFGFGGTNCSLLLSKLAD